MVYIGVNADPNPAFYLNADPDPDPGSNINTDTFLLIGTN